MIRFKYNAKSKAGYGQVGEGETELTLGTEEFTHHLLDDIARKVTKQGVPWDPFNIRLTVWAQSEPEPHLNIQTLDIKQLTKIFDDIFKLNDD